MLSTASDPSRNGRADPPLPGPDGDRSSNGGRQTNTLSLTLVAPFYNEQDGLEQFHISVKTQLDRLSVRYNLIYVDDASEDGTLERLNAIAAQDPAVRVLSLSRNFGHQIALSAGMDHAGGDVVITMDSDMQHPPSLIPELLAQFQQGAEVVYAVPRAAENLGWSKRVTAGLYYWLLRRATPLKFHPGAGDFRLMSRRVVDALVSMRETHRYLRGMVPWIGFPSAIVYYDQPGRFAGESKYTLRKMLALARNGLFSFSTVPLEFVSLLGFVMAILGVVYLFYIAIRYIVGGDLVPGWGSVIVVLLITGGIQLVSIGVIAQYIAMIFEQGKARPLYFLKQRGTTGQSPRGEQDEGQDIRARS